MSVIDKTRVKKILVISLTNLGDIIMTFPVIDILRRDFDQADLSVMIGPGGKPLLIDNPRIDHLYIYDKRMPFPNKVRWLNQLRKERFDMVVDLRHTIFPIFFMTRYRTPLIRRRDLHEHYRDQHLRYLYALHSAELSKERFSFFPSEKDRKGLQDFLAGQVSETDKIAVIGPSAADHRKRWSEEGFAKVADYLAQEHGLKIVFVGGEDDVSIISRVMARMKMTAMDLSGKANFPQVGVLLSRAAMVVVNDSSVMHLASYLGAPTVALFGPTNPEQSGPWGDWSGFIRHQEDCMACQVHDRDGEHTCMSAISPEEVMAMAERLLNPRF